jgi:hypothetical protein
VGYSHNSETGSILTSRDGVNWTIRSLGTTSWLSWVGKINRTFVVSGSSNPNFSAILQSDPVILSDVPLEYWAEDHIIALYDSGITGGCGNGNYCPNNPITRAQMAVFVLTSMGELPADACTGRFTDANEAAVGDIFCRYIEKFAALGITGGCSATEFCPDTPVTRGQMAVFIERALGNPPNSCTNRFGDVPSNDPFCGFIERLADDGITGGCRGGEFCPNNPVTRAEMAVFLLAAPAPLQP